eukprot:13772680-Alexandrium_andersonii.AAC.1
MATPSTIPGIQRLNARSRAAPRGALGVVPGCRSPPPERVRRKLLKARLKRCMHAGGTACAGVP